MLFRDKCTDSLFDEIAAETKCFSVAYLKELRTSASMIASDKGIDEPGGEEILDAFQFHSSQFRNANRDFEPSNKGGGGSEWKR